MIIAFTLIAVGIAASALTMRALQGAADGFEDDSGFHPQPSENPGRTTSTPLLRGNSLPLAQR
jgi:hypothetical protein